MVIGSVMGLLIYITIFMYGTMVMRSVMEEKTNRIMEVIISTIKPFQLMMGKIVGVGLVGLTQFFIWGVLLFGFTFIASLFLGAGFSSPPPTMGQMGAEQQLSNADVDNLRHVVEEILSANWFKIISSFVLYFIGGYFLYASLFAAIGSAVSEDMAEGQTLTIPITIPVAISFYIAMASLENPNSTLAIVSSYIPFFSPIVMTTRLGFDPPYWEILLSLILLYATCILCVWIASRIYRVGVLMYGKKVTFKELAKWAIQK
jgi:ABC-2 type transport system permease protein